LTRSVGSGERLRFRRCGTDDLEVLRAISRETYYDTFHHLCDPEDMRAYLDEAYAESRLSEELKNPSCEFYFLVDPTEGGTIRGYIKVNEEWAQSEDNGPEALELERIYVRKPYIGQGFGRLLMDKAIALALDRGKRRIWLGVWEKNERAIAFYERCGFRKAGTHAFVMGKDEQTDFTMIKDLR
jgi:ribosomal protein S18 acetylase RimI-like enzyme